ncbi:MAG: hypothetical protein ACRDPH_07985 [Marmoricola sp.]
MSRDTVDRCRGTSLHSGLLFGSAWFAAEWLVVTGGVEGEFAEQFAGLGVDDADVTVGDQSEDSGAGVLAAQADEEGEGAEGRRGG